MKQIRISVEFSKLLALGVSILFAATVFFCCVCWLIRDGFPEKILDYVDGPFMIVVSVYLAKSGVENVTKIRENPEEFPPFGGDIPPQEE